MTSRVISDARPRSRLGWLDGSVPVAAVGAGIWHGQSFPGPG